MAILVASSAQEFTIYLIVFIQCKRTRTKPGDGLDNDCDGRIDEEIADGIDNDNDGKTDEDLQLVLIEID